MNGGLVLVVRLMTPLMTHNTVWSIWIAGVSLENGFSEVWWAPVCHNLGDGLVLKAIMACLTKNTNIYGQCVSFLVPCHFS